MRERRQCHDEQREQDDRSRETGADRRRGPAPIVDLDDREHERGDAARHQQRGPGIGPRDVVAGNVRQLPPADEQRDAAPIGTLTKKIQRQLDVTSTPPTSGPSAAAKPPIAVQVRTAPPRRSGGKAASSRPSEVGVISAAPAACNDAERDQRSQTPCAAAQAAEAAVNSATPSRKLTVAAIALGEPAEEHQQRGIDDRIAVQDPRQILEIGAAEIARDVGQRDIDDEQVEIGETDADADDRQHLIGRRRARAP